MYDEDDGEYPAYDEPPIRPRRTFKLFGGIALLIYAVIGGALAQTITLNTNGRVEFGQGVVTLKACDSFISISLSPSESTFSGTRANGESYTSSPHVKNIIFSGLNVRSCAGRQIKVQLFNNINETPMNLFTDVDAISVNSAILVVDTSTTIAREDAITLLNGKGQNIGYFDAFQFLDYDPNTAIYTLIFTNPLALMSDVYRLTVETTNAS